jgi:hypothetical protein
MHRNLHGVSGVLGFLTLAMVLAAPAVQAQSQFLANVPFVFVLGDKSMDAGSYEIVSRGDEVALLRNMNTRVAYFLIRSQHVQSRSVEPAKLVFNKYGDQYFLSQIWDGSSETGIQLPKSKREKEVRMADNGITERPEIVVLAMK